MNKKACSIPVYVCAHSQVFEVMCSSGFGVVFLAFGACPRFSFSLFWLLYVWAVFLLCFGMLGLFFCFVVVSLGCLLFFGFLGSGLWWVLLWLLLLGPCSGHVVGCALLGSPVVRFLLSCDPFINLLLFKKILLIKEFVLPLKEVLAIFLLTHNCEHTYSTLIHLITFCHVSIIWPNYIVFLWQIVMRWIHVL